MKSGSSALARDLEQMSKELTSFVTPALKILGCVTRKCHLVLFCFVVNNQGVGYVFLTMSSSLTYLGQMICTHHIVDLQTPV